MGTVQNCLRRCINVAHMAKLSPTRLLQLSVKRLAQYALARIIGRSTPTCAVVAGGRAGGVSGIAGGR